MLIHERCNLDNEIPLNLEQCTTRFLGLLEEKRIISPYS